MSFGGSEGSTGIPGFSLKKFESQNEVDEKKKLRQEEWEKVRKAEDPEECPEAAVDNRCLYDKLEEQRLKKDEEFEEKVAFRNQVKRLDADETDFLHFCTERQQEIDQERKQEEETVISELKDAKVIKVLESKQDEKKARPLQQQQGKRSQLALLAGAVKRKGSEEASPNKKMRTDSTDIESSQKTEATDSSTTTTTTNDNNRTSASSQLARVIGVLPRALPGLTEYDDSSDSVSSSSDSEVDFSISGRNNAVMIVRQIQQHQH